ncbi:MAG TPA: hypothetical protein DDY37_07940, partial [Legionella sp.]|nr:hypothetical protein [Legionella sp.]
MPTLGIEMTDREPINGWESIIIKPMPRLVAAYNAAKNDADDAWDLYYQSVDQWEDTRTRFPNDRAKIKWATE